MSTKTSRKRRKAVAEAKRCEVDADSTDADKRYAELSSLVNKLQNGNFRILAEKRRLQSELLVERKTKSFASETYMRSLSVLNMWVRRLESALLEVHDRSMEPEIRALVVSRLHSVTDWVRGELET
jgi:hypothetical protein